jgi:hypothetical protein
MRISRQIVLFGCFLPCIGFAQQPKPLSAGESGIAAAARERYYNLPAAGFQSMVCQVAFDLSTISQVPASPDDPLHKLMQSTVFGLMLTNRGAAVQHRFPDGTSDAAQQSATSATQFLTSVVTGVFQAWSSKGFFGPIPLVDGPIESVVATENGYRMTLRTREAPVQLLLDKDFRATEAIGGGGKSEDHMTYLPTPEGLVLSSLVGESQTAPGVKSEVQYEFQTAMVDGLRVPSAAHLRVANQKIDVRFALGACTIKKGPAGAGEPGH